MPTIAPYSGTSAARLTAVINRDNNKNLRLGVDFVFQTPNGEYSGAAGRNTELVIAPAPGSKYTRPETLHYTRLDLSVLDDLPMGEISSVPVPEEGFSIHQILPQINAALGLSLTAAEVRNDTFGYQDQPTYPLTITESLAWLPGSVFNFPAHPVGDEQLIEAIPANQLDGLVYTAH